MYKTSLPERVLSKDIDVHKFILSRQNFDCRMFRFYCVSDPSLQTEMISDRLHATDEAGKHTYIQRSNYVIAKVAAQSGLTCIATASWITVRARTMPHHQVGVKSQCCINHNLQTPISSALASLQHFLFFLEGVAKYSSCSSSFKYRVQWQKVKECVPSCTIQCDCLKTIVRQNLECVIKALSVLYGDSNII